MSRARRVRSLGFNPRPRTGGDVCLLASVCGRECFNPRPRTGGDPLSDLMIASRTVSIRAPARGATRWPFARHHQGRSFNPRPRTGGDTSGWRLTWCAGRFKAPARGATRRDHQRRDLWIGFNPRPRTGGDDQHRISMWRTVSFNPRPPHGGDILHGLIRMARRVSIRAPARGATP